MMLNIFFPHLIDYGDNLLYLKANFLILLDVHYFKNKQIIVDWSDDKTNPQTCSEFFWWRIHAPPTDQSK